MKINNKIAQTLFDTGTTGTNLKATSFIQVTGIKTESLNAPIIIRLATKGSKMVAKERVTCNVEIAKGITIETTFLVVPIKDYQVIMGIPFLQKYVVKLDSANSTVIFSKYRNYTIKCNKVQSAAIIAQQPQEQVTKLLQYRILLTSSHQFSQNMSRRNYHFYAKDAIIR